MWGLYFSMRKQYTNKQIQGVSDDGIFGNIKQQKKTKPATSFREKETDNL